MVNRTRVSQHGQDRQDFRSLKDFGSLHCLPGGKLRQTRRRIARAVRAVAAAAVAAALFGLPQPAPSAEDLGELEQRAFRAAVNRVAPSVVRIETVGGTDRVGRVLFGAGPTTGLVFTPDGYIVSSAFNFLNRPASILVQAPDGGRKPAKLIATDHNRKIVLLKIDAARPLPVPEIAPPGELRVGQWAIAVGRTFEGGQPNLAVGVISAANRIWGKAIQTDAAVSPNNYGGPLVDVHGRVLGVLVPLSPQETGEMAGFEWYDSGIGFAIPAQTVLELLPRLKQGKDLYPGLVGINVPVESLYTGAPVIAGSRPGSPAHKAGLKAGDRIAEIDGLKIALATQIKQEISRRYTGDKMRVAVLRDGKRFERELELAAQLDPYQHPFLGILPVRPPKEHVEGKPAGVAVRYVYPESPAAKAGIQPGDVLLALGGRPIPNADDLRARMGEHLPGETVPLEFRHGEQAQKLDVVLAALPEDLPAAELPPAHAPVKPAEGPRPAVGTIDLKSDTAKNEAVAYVPEGYRPEVPHGIVVWLHGPSGLDAKELVAHWKPLCDRHDLILLAPKSADPKRWQAADMAELQVFLRELMDKYGVDTTRAVVHGHETGGTAALRLGFAGNSPFRGVAVVDAAVAGRPPENDPALRRAFYLAWGRKSEQAGPLKELVARLRAMKYPVTLKDLGPQPRYLTSEELAELARWIDTLDRI